MSHKVLITGVSGMLGKDVAKIFLPDKKYEVFGISRHRPTYLPGINFIQLNLTDLDKLREVLTKIEPDVIIHCAAMVNLNECETDYQIAKTINVDVSDILASCCNKKSRLIYISTDSVFNGARGGYLESDKTCPLNNYAKTKKQGEDIVLKNHPNSLVIRTNIFGFHDKSGSSLAEWSIENLSSKKVIDGYENVYFNPIYTMQLARVIKRIVDKKNFPKGILNVGSSHSINKYKFLIKLAEIFNYDKNLIKKTLMPEKNISVIRPKNTTLNIDKLKKILKQEISIENGLKDFKKDYLKHKAKK